MTTKVIPAPIPGTFYRRPSPDKPPFKLEGGTFSKGETLGLIEVMKTFSAVEAEEDGRIVRFLVDDEDPVMAGQPLYEIEV